jgi:hypothetical protein
VNCGHTMEVAANVNSLRINSYDGLYVDLFVANMSVDIGHTRR